jgi:hypothetical protein
MHIEWIYENQEIEHFNFIESTESREQKIPETMQLKSLHYAAKIGDIEAIKLELDRIRELDSSYEAFVMELEDLAANFDVESIEELLQKILLMS